MDLLLGSGGELALGLQGGGRRATTSVDLDPSSSRDGTYERVPTPKRHVDMMMYIMKHWPGNTNKSWKRQLFGDLAHGVTMINLFDFDTSWGEHDRL